MPKPTMGRELAKLYVGHQGDDAPSEATLAALREKVELEAPRRPANTIHLTIKEGQDLGKIDARFRDHFKPDVETRKTSERSFDFIIRQSAEAGIRERAVAQAKDIIHRRVDALGLREASVSSRDEDVIVEVPGEDEKAFAQIREIIGQTARLEFKLLDDESDYFAQLEQASTADSLPAGLVFQRENVPVGTDSEGERRTRVNTYAYLPIAPGENKQQTLTRLKEWIGTLTPPSDREVGYQLHYEAQDEFGTKEKEAGYRTFLLRSRTEITGDQVRDAAAQPDNSGKTLGGWYVGLTFTDQGGKLFEKVTGDNVKRRFAILLDGKVESAPEIIDRIAGGHASISMGSSDPQVQLRDARKLELVLRSGALPAPISPSNEQHIGPSLGRDAIQLGVQGAAAGGLLVLVFMVLYYKTAGLIADLAVLMNLFIQLAVLAMFGASMTLPGIAGLALTLGMSVDANVLINERIRDELAEGKSPRAAVELGYSRAFSAIIDGQLTTLIAALVLAQYGTGPIKGFAVNLMVGVACSIYTGVNVSKVLFDIWVRVSGKKPNFNLG